MVKLNEFENGRSFKYTTRKNTELMTPETKFKNQIKKFLDELGVYHIPYFPTIYTPKGIADILACVNGMFVGIEVKAEKGKPSKLQLHHQKKNK